MTTPRDEGADAKPGGGRAEPAWTEGVAAGATASLLGRAFYTTAQLGSHVLSARLLGSAGYGLFQLAVAASVLGSVATRAGLPRVALKYLPRYVERDDVERIGTLLRWTRARILALSALAALIVMVTAPLLARALFGKPALEAPLQLAAVTLPLTGLVFLIGAVGLGFGRVRWDVLGQHFAQPATFLLLMFGIALVPQVLATPASITGAYALSWGLALLALWVPYVRLMARYPAATPPAHQDRAAWRRFAAPLMASDLAARLNERLDFLIAGALLPAGLLGAYGASVRIAWLVAMILMSFSRVMAPRFSALFAREGANELAAAYRQTTFAVLALTVPVVLAAALLAPAILRVFGAEFAAGAAALVILLGGQLINAGAGASTYVLMMTGGERKLLLYSTAAGALNVVLSLALIPRFQAVGAAVANVAGIAVLNSWQILHMYRKLGIRPFDLTIARLLPPAAGAVLVALVVGRLLGQSSVLGAGAQAAAFGGTYVILAYVSGVWRQPLLVTLLPRAFRQHA